MLTSFVEHFVHIVAMSGSLHTSKYHFWSVPIHVLLDTIFTFWKLPTIEGEPYTCRDCGTSIFYDEELDCRLEVWNAKKFLYVCLVFLDFSSFLVFLVFGFWFFTYCAAIARITMGCHHADFRLTTGTCSSSTTELLTGSCSGRTISETTLIWQGSPSNLA